MARWRLTQAHYLNVSFPGQEPIQWEYKETDRNTGRQARKLYDVPHLLNPHDAADQNYPGEIVVCQPGKGQPRDIVFTGDPTPDMQPLDEEAEQISASFADKWKHPIETLPGQGGQGFSQSMIQDFERQLDALLAQRSATPVQNVSVGGVDPAQFAELQKQVQALMEQNAMLQAQAAEATSEDTRRL